MNLYTGESADGYRIRSGCSVFRTYNDFYSLEQKLKQFHGEKLIAQLPAKKIFITKDQEYLDVVRPRFESFLKVSSLLLDKCVPVERMAMNC